ncbi:MAG: glycosyltransferase family 4 protein [Lamprocystis purpurea]|nr:glycosyltransferase family 4 protein [Lamprocystis purpurea]
MSVLNDPGDAMQTVLIAHPCLASGGSEFRVLWGVEALRASCKVSIATGCPIDLARLNGHCGTNLEANHCDALLSPQWRRWAIGHTDALRGALFARFLRSVAARFDVCISGYNMMDFGRPAIHFVADFSFDDTLRRQFHPVAGGVRRWFHRGGTPRDGYLALARTLAGTSHYQGGEDWLVANSAWTADLLRSRLGLISNRVIFPPVADVAPTLAWEQREVGFVLTGRVSQEKRIERMIDILGRVRAAGRDVHLHIVGAVGDDGYGRAIRDQIARNAAWCFADGYLVGTAKMALLAQHRFAIHGCTGEAFGISVAEYVKAGCIPFVPSQGGPAEIVMSDELIYRDQDEAVAKIVALLDNPDRQRALQTDLAQRARMFSIERFMSEIRTLVADWLCRND